MQASRSRRPFSREPLSRSSKAETSSLSKSRPQTCVGALVLRAVTCDLCCIQVPVWNRKNGYFLYFSPAVPRHPGELLLLLFPVQTGQNRSEALLSAGPGDPGSDSGSNQRAGRTDSEGSPASAFSHARAVESAVSVTVLCAGAAGSGRLHERAVSRLHRRNQRRRGHP